MSEDLTKKLSDKDMILAAIRNLDVNVSKLDVNVSKIDSRLQGVETKVDRLQKKVDGLEKTVEERLYDTRPIWHRVIADISQLQSGQQRLEEAMHKVSNTVGNVSRDQIVINDAIRKIQLDFHAIDQRLLKLEINRNRENSTT